MKSFRNLLGAFTVIAMLGLVPVFAQSGVRVTANVPFAFDAGDRTLPAGQYTFVSAPNSPIAYLYPKDTTRGVAFLTNSNASTGPSERAVLTFHVYGDKSYFAGAWSPESASGRMLSPSRGEKEAEKGNAQREVAYAPAGGK